MIDTNVFIHIEKSGLAIDWSRWGPDRIYVSVVTVSELLVGVHRAKS